MKKRLFILGLFIALLFGANRSQATHIYGGDISYAYLGDTLGNQHAYGILMTLYLDCNSPNWLRPGGGGFPSATVTMNVFEGAVNVTSLPLSSQVGAFTLFLNDSVEVKSNLPNGCQNTNNVCVYKVTYTGVVVVPTSFVGYHFIYDRCCRTTLTNINVQGQSTGTLLHAWTASTSIKNTSPKFRDLDFPFLCQGDTNTVLNLAQDIDGHQLNYSFYEPFDGESGGPNPPGPYTGAYAAWPPAPVNYQTGFSLNQPFGNGGFASVNGLTGFTTLYSPITGTFVVGVEVKEIDQNGFTVGVIHREYQFPVLACNDTNTTAPVLQTAQTDYVIDAGDSLCFDIVYHDANGTLGWIYSVDGAVFNPQFTNPAATLSTPTITGDSSRQSFCWNTSCAQGRSTKYYFSVTAADSACLPGVTNSIFSIEVKPFDGPNRLREPPAFVPELPV
ncbi:hypothetical protein KFE98_13240 [bacterium SCSIO 12741]|nr:hypothetical protein KFE98_13240 [bacterium SCSIO 12741]